MIGVCCGRRFCAADPDVVGGIGDGESKMFCEGSRIATVEFWGWKDRYSTSDGCTLANASDTFRGIAPESLVELIAWNPGEVSRGGLSAEDVEGDETVSGGGAPSVLVALTLEGLGFRRLVSSLDDMTRV